MDGWYISTLSRCCSHLHGQRHSSHIHPPGVNFPHPWDLGPGSEWRQKENCRDPQLAHHQVAWLVPFVSFAWSPVLGSSLCPTWWWWIRSPPLQLFKLVGARTLINCGETLAMVKKKIKLHRSSRHYITRNEGPLPHQNDTKLTLIAFKFQIV